MNARIASIVCFLSMWSVVGLTAALGQVADGQMLSAESVAVPLVLFIGAIGATAVFVRKVTLWDRRIDNRLHRIEAKLGIKDDE